MSTKYAILRIRLYLFLHQKTQSKARETPTIGTTCLRIHILDNVIPLEGMRVRNEGAESRPQTSEYVRICHRINKEWKHIREYMVMIAIMERRTRARKAGVIYVNDLCTGLDLQSNFCLQFSSFKS